MLDGKKVMPDSIAESDGITGIVELTTGSGRSVTEEIGGSSVMVADAVGSEV